MFLFVKFTLQSAEAAQYGIGAEECLGLFRSIENNSRNDGTSHPISGPVLFCDEISLRNTVYPCSLCPITIFFSLPLCIDGICGFVLENVFFVQIKSDLEWDHSLLSFRKL
jgi:hypothetical protein